MRRGLLHGIGITTPRGKVLSAGIIGITLAVGPTTPARVATHNPQQGVKVIIDPWRRLGTIPATAFGLNTAVWDGQLLNSSVARLLQTLDIGLLRFPGGSTADVYDWKTNTVVPGQSGYANPHNQFLHFMQLVNQIHATPIITVNYGSNFLGTGGGNPQQAAAWVHYANITHGEHVKYWEIGNEVYGNGSYGKQWEVDLHRVKGPRAYAENALQYIKDMRAVDPHIKIGVVLTMPYNWPWGVAPNWNKRVLTIDGSAINFVSVHWYPQMPGHESDKALLADTAQIPHMVRRLRQELDRYAGAYAKHIQIFVTETNSVSSNPGKQTTSMVNALFLDNDYMTWLENGIANVTWWDLHNSATHGNSAPQLYGNTPYGDYGMLSNGSSVAGMIEPKPNTPFPTYYGYQMLTYLGHPGDVMLATTGSRPHLKVYAVQRKHGILATMLVNTSPSDRYQVTLKVAGGSLAGRAILYRYGEQSTRIGVTSAPSFQSIAIGPYSVVVIVCRYSN